jgi:hypothetical protein
MGAINWIVRRWRHLRGIEERDGLPVENASDADKMSG